MESIPPSKRNTQADIQLRTRQTNHQQETDGCIQIKHNPEHQPSRMSRKSTAYVPPKTASTPTKANTQTCSYLDFNQFLIRRITRNICLRLRIKQIQILITPTYQTMPSDPHGRGFQPAGSILGLHSQGTFQFNYIRLPNYHLNAGFIYRSSGAPVGAAPPTRPT